MSISIYLYVILSYLLLAYFEKKTNEKKVETYFCDTETKICDITQLLTSLSIWLYIYNMRLNEPNKNGENKEQIIESNLHDSPYL